MADMLVKLYALPPLVPARDRLAAEEIAIRPGMAHERDELVAWIARHFHPRWASEAGIGFTRQPSTTLIALHRGQPLGFACHEVTARGFFGPMAVLESARGRGLGEALLLEALHAMRARGYAYAIIGGVGPKSFYARAAGAVEIPDSTPGIYADPLQPPETP